MSCRRCRTGVQCRHGAADVGSRAQQPRHPAPL